MAHRSIDAGVYTGTYSNVPVYEIHVDGEVVMRRRNDDWINATHILKVAAYDKPARTRILEREVQKGIHEKIQGGYGKFQGTWIPLDSARDLAAKNGVLDKISLIFDYVPGTHTPPPAPKHAASGGSKPRAPRNSQRKATRAPSAPSIPPMSEYSSAAPSMAGDQYETATMGSEMHYQAQNQNLSPLEEARTYQRWADDLLDFFMISSSVEYPPIRPSPPINANHNRIIDNSGHTILHWSAAMADLEVVRELIELGASVDVISYVGQSPLMRAVQFLNSYDKQNMESLVEIFISTVCRQDYFGNTVLHHVAGIAETRNKFECASYYMDAVLNKMIEHFSPDVIETVINQPNVHNDTALTIAARLGARKCVHSLLARNASMDVVSNTGETADQLIMQLNARSQGLQNSSSPNDADAEAVAPSVTDAAGSTSTSYLSAAAMSITSNVAPNLSQKLRVLASMLDRELLNTDAQMTEAKRALAHRQAGCDALLRLKAELEKAESDALTLDPHGEHAKAVEQELCNLEILFHQLIGQENDDELDCLTRQAITIHGLSAQNGPKDGAQAQVVSEVTQGATGVSHPPEASAGYHGTSQPMVGKSQAGMSQFHPGVSQNVSTPTGQPSLNSRIQLQERIRAELLKHVSTATGLASNSGNMDMFSRLLGQALNVPEQDVRDLLPDVAAELEDKMG
ncbi:apses-domain-containing protein [Piedraia hortae CBS 480.64]|uniref:Apses-domain-containing protein n=1 Tax=Piedraia hortae CBS 480.64 TaxID=1314780 RepID=A0A6A7BTU7_9PEZI|nr:apses-domain-containing protein [Piedraia hortae CBS 480.64]